MNAYIRELEEALGTDGFAAVYVKVAQLSREQVNEIASGFVSRTPKSATKSKSLGRIQQRHNDIVNMERKNAWQRGKSAA